MHRRGSWRAASMVRRRHYRRLPGRVRTALPLVRVSSVRFIVGTGWVGSRFVPTLPAGLLDAPANDCCENATPVGDGTFPFTTVGVPTRLRRVVRSARLEPRRLVRLRRRGQAGHASASDTRHRLIDVGVTVLDGSCSGRATDARRTSCTRVFGMRFSRRSPGTTTLVRLHNVHFEIPIPRRRPRDGLRAASASNRSRRRSTTNCDTATNITGWASSPYDNDAGESTSGPDDAPSEFR